jgi:hypothetical protein
MGCERLFRVVSANLCLPTLLLTFRKAERTIRAGPGAKIGLASEAASHRQRSIDYATGGCRLMAITGSQEPMQPTVGRNERQKKELKP